MSSKTSPCETATTPSKSLGNCQALTTRDVEHKCITASPSKEIVLLSQGDIIEVTVKRDNKTKGQKRASPMVNSGHEQKAEKKRSTSGETLQVPWSRVFAEQNLLHMKQSQASMSTKGSESKDTREHIGAKRQQTNGVKHPVLSKRTSYQKKSGDNSKTPCCLPIFVQDRAIQHPDIADNANKFAEFNPAHALSGLVKELKDLVKNDKRTSEIFTEMQQIVSKIPVYSEKSLEFEDLQVKLQSGTIQLKESSKKMKAMCESWATEREKLHSQIQKQKTDLKEANQKQADLEIEKRMLAQQLEDAIQTAKDEVTALRRQIKKDEVSEKLVSNLRTEVAEQTELARQSYIDNQYLAIERDKLLQLSSYQETLITKYQHTIKELQAQVAEQLKALTEARVANEENGGSSQISMTQTGFMCSSPTSSFSDHDSNKSWQDLSEVSSVAAEHDALPKENVPVKDSVHLELVSLQYDGETSQDITLESCQNRVTGEEVIARGDNRNDTIIGDANTRDAITKKFPHRSAKKDRDKGNDDDLCETKNETSSDNVTRMLHRDVPGILRGGASNKLVPVNTRKQENTPNRIPINVPSPLREYPCPDWTNSTLSSVSLVASELDIVPSNKV